MSDAVGAVEIIPPVKPPYVGERDARGHFLPGTKPPPDVGRPKGSRSKLGEAFLADMYDDWKEHGPEVVKKVREEKPAEYLRVVASVLPKELHFSETILDQISDEELDRIIIELERVKITAIAK
jgi:hypothetical protein